VEKPSRSSTLCRDLESVNMPLSTANKSRRTNLGPYLGASRARIAQLVAARTLASGIASSGAVDDSLTGSAAGGAEEQLEATSAVSTAGSEALLLLSAGFGSSSSASTSALLLLSSTGAGAVAPLLASSSGTGSSSAGSSSSSAGAGASSQAWRWADSSLLDSSAMEEDESSSAGSSSAAPAEAPQKELLAAPAEAPQEELLGGARQLASSGSSSSASTSALLLLSSTGAGAVAPLLASSSGTGSSSAGSSSSSAGAGASSQAWRGAGSSLLDSSAGAGAGSSARQLASSAMEEDESSSAGSCSAAPAEAPQVELLAPGSCSAGSSSASTGAGSSAGSWSAVQLAAELGKRHALFAAALALQSNAEELQTEAERAAAADAHAQDGAQAAVQKLERHGLSWLLPVLEGPGGYTESFTAPTPTGSRRAALPYCPLKERVTRTGVGMEVRHIKWQSHIGRVIAVEGMQRSVVFVSELPSRGQQRPEKPAPYSLVHLVPVGYASETCEGDKVAIQMAEAYVAATETAASAASAASAAAASASAAAAASSASSASALAACRGALPLELPGYTCSISHESIIVCCHDDDNNAVGLLQCGHLAMHPGSAAAAESTITCSPCAKSFSFTAMCAESHDVGRLLCGHFFCFSGIAGQSLHGTTCPACRRPFSCIERWATSDGVLKFVSEVPVLHVGPAAPREVEGDAQIAREMQAAEDAMRMQVQGVLDDGGLWEDAGALQVGSSGAQADGAALAVGGAGALAHGDMGSADGDMGDGGCRVCGSDSLPDDLMICGSCERGYWHWTCIGMSAKPGEQEHFSCPDCFEQQQMQRVDVLMRAP
jgi:hypothetical protein